MIERLQGAWSKVPLTRKSLLLGLLLGLVLWAVLDALQSVHLHRLLHRELEGTLALQAAVHQRRFNEEVHRTEGVLRLLARHAWVVERAVRVREEPAVPARPGNEAWLPPQDAWEGLVMPAAFVLSDHQGRVREVVNLGALDRSVLPDDELAAVVEQARSGVLLVDVAEVPVLVTTQPVVDARGESLALLSMLSAIDERFLGLVLADSIGQGLLVLTRAGDGAIVASSHPCTVGTDETLQGLGSAYLQSGVPLGTAVVGDSSMRLVTLIDHGRLASLDGAVLGLSRQQRFIAAMAFIGLFTLIILASARRIERLRERVEKFIEAELRGSPAGLRSGDQILDLERRFTELTEAVLKGRDAMRRNYRLQAHVDQLEVLYAVTERLSVGVVSVKDGHAVPLNATMQRYVDECGGIARFGNLEGGIGRLEMDCRSAHQRVFDLKSLETGKGERVVLVRDVTELEKQRAALEFQSLHDGLTSLPNRVLLNDRLEQSLSAAARNQGVVTLVLIDINRFKDVNETLGHQAGDEVLRRVVDRFHAVIRSDDTLARIGGDEFAIILRDCDTRQAFHVCDKLAVALHEPLLIADHKVAMDISIGLAGFPRDARDAETLMRRADAALAHAKSTQQPLCSFDARLDASSKDRLLLMAELRDALRHGDNGLMLHYQPQVRIQDGRIMAVEALLRWDHAARGMVPPGAFIPMVEQSPLINHLTRWVIDAALSDVVHWRKLQPELRVAVNLSTRNLADPGLVPYVVDRLGHYGVPAEALVLEITESAIMWDPARARAILQTLQSMGVGISVDDFGTGHSSLAYLSRLPVSELKVDRTFVQGMLRRNIDRTIVHATVDLGHNLGLEVVAEGVETPEEFDALRAIGCDLVQGYLLGRPMPAADMEALLAEGRLPMPDPPASKSGGPTLIYQRERR